MEPLLYRGTFNQVFNPATETACIKTQETKLPGTRQLNDANRKKKMNILQIGLGSLFICLFFYTLPIDRLAGVFRVSFWCFRAYHVRGCE